MEKFLKSGKLTCVLWSQCTVIRKDTGISENVSRYHKDEWEVLNSCIATLPERVTNRLKTETSDIFFPETYITMVSHSILICLERIYHAMMKQEDISMLYLSYLLGKLCICGHADRIWALLLPHLMENVKKNGLWCRICEHLVTKIPDIYLESVITPLVQKIPWYGYMSKFLGHSILENHKVKFLLTNKFLMLRYFNQVQILQNIFGYMYQSGTIKPLILKTMLKLLSVWSDKSALKHTSYEQHIYISKGLIIASAFITEKDAKERQTGILDHLMTGLQNHLDSVNPSVRRQGMIIAEFLTLKMNIQSEKLKFEYEEDSESKELKYLFNIPDESKVASLEKSILEMDLEKEAVVTLESKKSETSTSAQEQDNLDSDDDLEPYDLSNDQKISKVKKPLYIRDCMEGLIKSGEDPNKLELCLQEAEKLIRLHSVAAREVSKEFAKILLHLQDNFSLPEFTVLRFRSMVAILVEEPTGVAEYFTTQFYERNYNIRQRLDILEVLATAAKELSNPASERNTSGTSLKQPFVQLYGRNRDDNTANRVEDWKDIVQKRIDSKTRRFASGRSKNALVPVANRFMSVAGGFFFPLLVQFDRPENTLDMLGEDHIVLSRLVYTLGVIVHASQNAHVCSNMSSSLLEFIWVLRYHEQPAVRQGLLFATCMVLLSLPPYILFGEMQGQITETKTWLQDVAEKDCDKECQKMAVQALIIIDNLLKQQFSESNT